MALTRLSLAADRRIETGTAWEALLACLVQGAPEAPVVLVVSPRRGRIVDVESLRRRYEQQVGPTERPDEIRGMRALPRSHLQKLLRREVRSLLAFA